MKKDPNKEQKKLYDESIKIILLGEVYTGKTSLINTYIKNEFKTDIESTTAPSYLNKIIKVENKTYMVSIWDTAGQEQFRSMNKIFIKDSNIVLFIYDITRKKTFNELTFWVEYVESCIGKDNALYGVVGNKLDLFDKEEELKKDNIYYQFEIVDTNQGKDFAEKIGAEFLETSAKEKAPGFDNLIYNLIDNYANKNMFSVKSDAISLSTEHPKLNKKKKCCD